MSSIPPRTLAPLLCAVALALLPCMAASTTPDDRGLSPEATGQLINAVAMDAMTEAAVEACRDLEVPSHPRLRAAWTAWRERHQLGELRHVVNHLKPASRFRSKTEPEWDTIMTPMRNRVLQDAAPDKVCAQLAHDLATPTMDVTALYGQARVAAAALVKVQLAWPPSPVPAVSAAPGAQVLLLSQIEALAGQHKDGWRRLPPEEAQRRLGHVYLKGWVERFITDRYQLVHEQGGREASMKVELPIHAEAWLGREVVVRGVATTLQNHDLELAQVALVIDAANLIPSPLPQSKLRRRSVISQRVMTAPGKGVPDKDVETVGIYGEADYSNGSSWREEVRYFLRDGTSYGRTSIPLDQLDVAASRKLEPDRWSRWRKGPVGYELQHWDDDGRPEGDWRPVKHLATRRWPADTRLNGYYQYMAYHGSLMLGGTTVRRGYVFTPDGRFESSASASSGSGGMAASGGTVVSASAHADGKGSSSVAGGTSNGATAVSSSRSQDDGAGRRGRYRLSGYTLELDYDNGARARLLCFPVSREDNKTVYIGFESYSLK